VEHLGGIFRYFQTGVTNLSTPFISVILYGVESVQIGLPLGAFLAKAPPRLALFSKPVCIYGTSITQGGCASRPGMAYTAILDRRLDRPVINLGFSGNGPVELEVGRFLAELDPALCVLDCLPNMEAPQVNERAVPFVKLLRQSRPDTPIVLVENIAYTNAGDVPARRESYTSKNAAPRKPINSWLRSDSKRSSICLVGHCWGKMVRLLWTGPTLLTWGFCAWPM
jgi:hypothetical protein